MSMFHVAVDRAWVLNSWDRMMIPKPFSRALLRFGKLIHVPEDATDEDVERYTPSCRPRSIEWSNLQK